MTLSATKDRRHRADQCTNILSHRGYAYYPWRPTVIVQFHRRAHLPIVLASGRLNTPVHGALVEWSAAFD